MSSIHLSDSRLIHNREVLARYHQLQESNKNPILAVYRNRELVITSHQTKGVLKSLANRVKKLGCGVSAHVGLITKNVHTIALLQEEVARSEEGEISRSKKIPYEALLTMWEKDSAVKGNKIEAVRRIREALQNRSITLNLSDLKLTQMAPTRSFFLS